MYTTGEIDNGGFIYAHLKFRRTMMHRETRVPKENIPFSTLEAAKEDFHNPSPHGHPGLLLSFNDDGSVKCLWCYEADITVIQRRLGIWSGCYGAWKLRRLNAA